MPYVCALLAIILTLMASGCTLRDPKPVFSSVMPIKSSVPATAPAALAPRATVLFFLATDCPISNGYAPEIARICTDYAPLGVSFQAVYPDPDTSSEQAIKHRADYALPCPAAIDPDHRLTQQAGATITPEVAVFVPGGPGIPARLVYRGRIDDRHTDLGRSRPTAGIHDLRDTLDAVLQGQPPIELIIKPAVGCHIPDKKG